MCGKFTQQANEAETIVIDMPAGTAPVSSPQDTVTPMRFASVLTLNARGDRVVRRMRWGFVPFDAPDQMKYGAKFIHARAETVDTKPTFRDAFLKRRGLVVVDSFNEGEEVTPKKTQQYVVTPKERTRLAIAVIWERWGGPGPIPLDTFAMVTTPPNALIGTITDRMPAVIQSDQWAKWLGEEPASVQELKEMLAPFEGDWRMEAAPKASRPRPAGAGESDPQPSLF